MTISSPKNGIGHGRYGSPAYRVIKVDHATARLGLFGRHGATHFHAGRFSCLVASSPLRLSSALPGPAAAVELDPAAVIDNRPDQITWQDNPSGAKDGAVIVLITGEGPATGTPTIEMVQ
jgi:hypothetical protein